MNEALYYTQKDADQSGEPGILFESVHGLKPIQFQPQGVDQPGHARLNYSVIKGRRTDDGSEVYLRYPGIAPDSLRQSIYDKDIRPYQSEQEWKASERGMGGDKYPASPYALSEVPSFIRRPAGTFFKDSPEGYPQTENLAFEDIPDDSPVRGKYGKAEGSSRNMTPETLKGYQRYLNSGKEPRQFYDNWQDPGAKDPDADDDGEGWGPGDYPWTYGGLGLLSASLGRRAYASWAKNNAIKNEIDPKTGKPKWEQKMQDPTGEPPKGSWPENLLKGAYRFLWADTDNPKHWVESEGPQPEGGGAPEAIANPEGPAPAGPAPAGAGAVPNPTLAPAGAAPAGAAPAPVSVDPAAGLANPDETGPLPNELSQVSTRFTDALPPGIIDKLTPHEAALLNLEQVETAQSAAYQAAKAKEQALLKAHGTPAFDAFPNMSQEHLNKHTGAEGLDPRVGDMLSESTGGVDAYGTPLEGNLAPNFTNEEPNLVDPSRAQESAAIKSGAVTSEQLGVQNPEIEAAQPAPDTTADGTSTTAPVTNAAGDYSDVTLEPEVQVVSQQDMLDDVNSDKVSYRQRSDGLPVGVSTNGLLETINGIDPAGRNAEGNPVKPDVMVTMAQGLIKNGVYTVGGEVQVALDNMDSFIKAAGESPGINTGLNIIALRDLYTKYPTGEGRDTLERVLKQLAAGQDIHFQADLAFDNEEVKKSRATSAYAYFKDAFAEWATTEGMKLGSDPEIVKEVLKEIENKYRVGILEAKMPTMPVFTYDSVIGILRQLGTPRGGGLKPVPKRPK